MASFRAWVLLLALGLAALTPCSRSFPAGEEAEKAPDAEAAALPRAFERLRFGTRRGGRHLRRIPPPPPPSQRVAEGDDILELTFDQVLDHFKPTDERTWKQRYFARADLYKEGGPVFIYIGGEGQEEEKRLSSGDLFMTFLAEKYKAKMFDLEHRFYGKSHPTEDLTPANLEYLSADQALADLAYFIEYLIEHGDIEAGQKVAVFGGSYPGNLAAWARIKYPHLISAAVSSSAPVHAKADFVEYMEVVARSLDKVAGTWCSANLKKAMDRIVQLITTSAGYEKVRKVFHVGSELKDKLDLDTFFSMLSNPFAGAVQYNRKEPPNSPYNIDYICSFIQGNNLSPDEAMQKLANLVLGDAAQSEEEFDFSYKSTVAQYRITDYIETSPGEFDAGRQWLYQTCTEFGYFQTFSGNGTPFPPKFNDVDYDFQLCKDVFGEVYNQHEVGGAIKRTNLVFGDRKPDVTNVIFMNGDIDPWHALGILDDVSPLAPAVFIDGGSHCADMNYPNPDADTQAIIDAHDRVHKFIREALYVIPDGDPADA